jgi:hypothetical protein
LVKINWKILHLAICGAALLAAAGCSGINTSQSVSPATFLLPGLMKADPSPAHPGPVAPATVPVEETVRS